MIYKATHVNEIILIVYQLKYLIQYVKFSNYEVKNVYQ